jgi:hypothetical protein
VVTRTFTLGRYTCVERLGIDPLGELWRAKRFGLIGVERQFLLTRLHPPLAKDTAAVSRLQAALKTYADLEVELLTAAEAAAGAGETFDGRLLHLHEQASTPGGADHYVVCEFPGFADLRKLRAGFDLVVAQDRAAELWPAVLLLVGRAVSSVLAQAHGRALWHGTLSPSAIYLGAGAGGRVYVAQLGFAQALPQSAAAWTTDANIKPLLAYVPKEVQAGTAPGPECDIYALGVILGDLLVNVGKHADALRAVVDRARAAARNERPQTMRELSAAFAALPLPLALQTEAQRTLTKLAQQFQLTGDSVPQPVTVSERSSAEPLPPPPGGKSVDISKANIGVSGRMRASGPGAKPVDKDARKAMRDISDISQPPRHVAPPPPETATIARHESEETPLPASRPLLVTHPKLEAVNPDPAAQKAALATDAKAAPDGDKGPRTGSQDKPRRQSKDDLRVQKARSGIDWLTSKSDQLPVGEAAEKLDPAPRTPSKPPVTGEQAKPSAPPRTPTPPSGQPQRRSNPVSINPRARAAKIGPSASATTPTAEVDIEEASAAELETGATPSAATLDERPKSASTLRDAASALASGTDHLSVGETNPQLAPVKVFKPKAALGEEPTNPVSLEEVALAASLNQDEAKPKRRSGPISEPNPRVLSSTAPAEIVLVPGGVVISPPDVLGNTGLAKPVSPLGDPQTQDFLVDGVPSAEPRRPRTGLLIGGAVALLLACGLIYLLIAVPNQTASQNKLDGGAGAGADGGATAAKEKVPADSLVLNTTPPAAVFLDGVDKGKTPLTLKVASGTHKLVLVAELYSLLRKDVTGGTKLDLKLEGAKLPADVVGEAELKIKCKSVGKLRILVDGNDSGRSCPTDELRLSPGKHVLSFLDPATDATKEKKIKAKKGKKPAKIKVKY